MNSLINHDTLSGAFEMLTQRIFRHINCAIPCVIESVKDRMTVDVRPSIKIMLSDHTFRSRSVIKGIPVINLSTSGFSISLPLKKNDTGLLIACDRDISNYLSSKSESEPATARMHSFSDAFFIPNSLENIEVSSDNSESLVIQNKAGNVYISVNDDAVNINGVTVDKDGNITAKKIKADEVEISGTKLSTHVHAGVTTGKDSTLPMSKT